MGFDLSLHHVRAMTAELLIEPVSLTLRFEQALPTHGGRITAPDSVEVSVFLTGDQDAADAYLLGAAINASAIGVDDLEDRRRRAAMALGWVYQDETPERKGGWGRPARESDGGMLRIGGAGGSMLWANDVEQALHHDLGDFF